MNTALSLDRTTRVVPPQAWFAVSAIFHYLGPSFAVFDRRPRRRLAPDRFRRYGLCALDQALADIGPRRSPHSPPAARLRRLSRGDELQFLFGTRPAPAFARRGNRVRGDDRRRALWPQN